MDTESTETSTEDQGTPTLDFLGGETVPGKGSPDTDDVTALADQTGFSADEILGFKRGELPKGIKDRIDKLTARNYQTSEQATKFEAELSTIRAERDQMKAQVEAYEAAAKDPEPDLGADPNGWREWALRDAQRKAGMQAAPKSADSAPAQDAVNSAVRAQAEILRTVHSDYDQVAAFAGAAIDKNPVLKATIFGSENPAQAVYEYGLELLSKRGTGEIETPSGLSGERTGAPQSSDDGLSDAERWAARFSGLSEKQYMDAKGKQGGFL